MQPAQVMGVRSRVTSAAGVGKHDTACLGCSCCEGSEHMTCMSCTYVQLLLLLASACSA
jgi:hypothetical protein